MLSKSCIHAHKACTIAMSPPHCPSPTKVRRKGRQKVANPRALYPSADGSLPKDLYPSGDGITSQRQGKTLSPKTCRPRHRRAPPSHDGRKPLHRRPSCCAACDSTSSLPVDAVSTPSGDAARRSSAPAGDSSSTPATPQCRHPVTCRRPCTHQSGVAQSLPMLAEGAQTFFTHPSLPEGLGNAAWLRLCPNQCL
jgi:hypothetical protein